MAPAVPFALLGVVQLASVAVWLGVAGAACFPRLRRRTTALVVAGAIAMAVADALTALRLHSASSDVLGEVRLGGLALLAIGLGAGALTPRATLGVPAIVVPLGARPSIAIAGGVMGLAASLAAVWRARGATGRLVASWLAAGLLLTAVATTLADPARTHTNAALAVLAARAAATAAFGVVLVLIARDNLLGKLLGSIVAGVVAMAIGAVAVVGIGVAGEVQHDQSQRLLGVATVQQQALQAVATRAGIYAHVVAACPTRTCSVNALTLFSVDPDYFALVDVRGHGAGIRSIAQSRHALQRAALLQIAGSDIVSGALARDASPQLAASGALLLHGSPPRLAIVAAVPGRPGGSNNAQVRPSFAAVYGIGLTSKYLDALASQIGYDVTILSGRHVIASSLTATDRRQVLAAALDAGVDRSGPRDQSVVPAQGNSPTVAFVPISGEGNDNVRLATMAISQPASAALAAQRSVLRRLVLTASPSGARRR